MAISGKWVKRVLTGLVVTVLLGSAVIYVQAKRYGLIPRADYDEVAPGIPPLTQPAILVLSKTNGYIHREALPAGQAMLRKLADERGWSIYLTENAASHNPEDLARFNVVVWNNVSGDVLTPDQRQALKAWIGNGGGWVGIHASGGDPGYEWAWYVDTSVDDLPQPSAGYSSRPDFTVLAYPVISFGKSRHGASRTNLLGEDPEPALIELLSAEKQVDAGTPPAFIWAPETDTVVPYENSVLYAEALDAAGIENELHVFPEGVHGSALASDEKYASKWPELMLQWLRKLDFQ